jgi:hypothetical protein
VPLARPEFTPRDYTQRLPLTARGHQVLVDSLQLHLKAEAKTEDFYLHREQTRASRVATDVRNRLFVDLDGPRHSQANSDPNFWLDAVGGLQCAVGGGVAYDAAMQAFLFDGSAESLITCPLDLSPTSNANSLESLTIEVELYPTTTRMGDHAGSRSWVITHDNNGYDRSVIVADDRYATSGAGAG